MQIADEKANLAFDTGVLKKAAKEYKSVAKELRRMSARLDELLNALKSEGWTTPTGTAFYEMTNTNWEKNIEKYAALLESLNEILIKASNEYENLMTDHVRTTQVKDI